MKKLSLALLLALCSITVMLAQRTIKGTVTDAKGEGLIGVSIFAKGTSSGTITDVDGAYELQVSAGVNTLVFSYTGFQTQDVPLGVSNVIDLQMTESTEQLSEIVVTAIGIQRDKKALGYSVSDLTSDQLAQRSETDVLRSMAAKTPGVVVQGGGGSPGQSTRINIRGYSSLTGNTQPLFVVDGVPFDNSVNASVSAAGGTQFSNRAFDIDPNNIASMAILKGAAAAALYGSRAANGVVVITTKVGKKTRKGLEVSYSSSMNWEKVSSLPDYQKKYGQGANQLYNGAFVGNWGAPFADYVDEINAEYGTTYPKVIVPGYPEGTVPHPLTSNAYNVQRGYQAFFPEFMEVDPNDPTKMRAIPVPYKNHDFINNFFDTGTLVENSLNISAGGDNSSVNASASHMDNTGIVPTSKSSRTSIAFGGSSKLANGLLVSGSMNYVNTQQDSPPINGSIFDGATNFGGLLEGSIFGRLFHLPRNYDLDNYPIEIPGTGDNAFYRALDNPYWLIKNNKYTSDVNRVFGNLAFSYDVAPWLTLTARGGMNNWNETRRNARRPGGVADTNGGVWTDDLGNREVDINYLATLSPKLTNDIDLRVIVGFNQNQRTFSNRFLDADGLIDKNLYSTQGTTTQIVREDYRRKQRLYAVYADVMVDYRDWLYFGVVGRNDWSSTLPESNNSFFYPGFNAAADLTHGLNLASNALSYWKVRASWAQVGNEARPYLTGTPYSFVTPFTTAGGTKVNRESLSNTVGNPELKHELTTEIEFGTDFRLFRNRIGLDLTYYKRNAVDQITEAQVPSSTGYWYAVVNAGEVENKGWEIGLDLTPVRTAGGLTWNIYSAFTKNKSTVIDAGFADDLFIGGPGQATGIVHRTGEEYGQIFGSMNARTTVDGKEYILIDRSTGTTIFLPKSEIIGNPNPDFILAVTNTISYKGLKLGVLFDWKQGGDLYSITAGSLQARGQLKNSEEREPLRVIPGYLGDPATFEALKDENGQFIRNTVPITSFDYTFSNGFGYYGADETMVYDITTIRLREVSLSYDLPEGWLKRTPLGTARISISGRNLWFKVPNMLSGVNLDPEVLSEVAESNVQGFEFGSTPTTKRFGINLNVTF
ncbi:MAG: SusC/RagA family TonB-linked outer membrane protein [Bacteroidetes bacterium]|nr:SusC/RagA family TonB-linked outer membrane protein [Bacteroidota bacterium]